MCWWYSDAAEFRLRAREFLVDGLAAGQRVRYVGSAPEAVLTRELDGVTELAEALRDGTAQVRSLAEAYPGGSVVDPDEQVAVYARATEEAVADGFTGFRVAADATALVRAPDQLAAFLRYEHLIDRYMSENPMSAMCGYDRSELGDPAVAQLACLHPQTNVRLAGFRLHAASDRTVALAGELDMTNRSLLDSALDRVDLAADGGEMVVDAPELAFIDHACLLRLAGYAERRGVALVLRTDWPGASRMAQVLGLSRVRVERAA
ncbi:MEDS domain-containing protein [Actinokineospora fastidiosa]|uniref:MEDS domain-containing protein n=1 Tax=Actinokineospora fastidiosa TaxID=1816 RepID=A0A918LEM7_9PSEU|nr:MEDS domain-containing protein [Actinokineospora fastidiosa]GGS36825.1 hypothetical protein GCM10010171_34590 [Actinokineospora fastidiosa]